MQFVNIVVHSVEDMNFRVHLQYEFTQLGIDDFLEKLRHHESEELQVIGLFVSLGKMCAKVYCIIHNIWYISTIPKSWDYVRFHCSISTINHLYLQIQISAYLDNVFDVAALMEDSETKTAALERVAELEDELALVSSQIDLEIKYFSCIHFHDKYDSNNDHTCHMLTHLHSNDDFAYLGFFGADVNMTTLHIIKKI